MCKKCDNMFLRIIEVISRNKEIEGKVNAAASIIDNNQNLKELFSHLKIGANVATKALFGADTGIEMNSLILAKVNSEFCMLLVVLGMAIGLGEEPVLVEDLRKRLEQENLFKELAGNSDNN